MQTQNLMKFEIEEEFDDIRIDKVLSEYLSDLSRTYIQKPADFFFSMQFHISK